MRLVAAIFALAFPILAQQPGLVAKYCVGCHNQKLKTAGLVLEGLDADNPGRGAGIWERVLRQVSAGQMPPAGLPRPDAATVAEFCKRLEAALDRAAASTPNPGAPMPHRLNRTEYSNAVRDLLGVDTKPGEKFPVDESGSGFDNMADLLSMSPALVERYLSAARGIARLAVGDLAVKPGEETFSAQGRTPQSEEVPFGSRGGLAVEHYFPLDAEYEFQIQLAGASEENRARGAYKLRLPVKAGSHLISAAFLRESAKAEISAPVVGRRGPAAEPAPAPAAEMDLRLDGERLKRFLVTQRTTPEIATVTIAGPFQPTGRGDTPSRRKIFLCKPVAKDEEPCARTIVANLARRAFRRPVTDADINPLMAFYNKRRRADGDFDQGIQAALEAVLVSPDFLFRFEPDPPGAAPGSVYRTGDLELASRLSFFLWSSVPDDELLKLAEAGQLRDPAVRKAQVRRMMLDPKSDALIRNFGGQWLFLRTLDGAKPDADIFSNFDEPLRGAFRTETELFLASIFRENHSVLALLDADYTFVNQRLARFYGMPGIYGAHFRKARVTDANRRGLLGQGSVLTVTSYPNRTSVVQRGKWILENLLGTPPPPPPADVPEVKTKSHDGKPVSLRAAMEEHRKNPVCASCHGRMDPIGFALENFNAVGEWRSEDAGVPIDNKGTLPDGTEFQGPAGLRKLLLEKHRDEFVLTVTEKLLTYALGRGVELYDKPTVRAIARQAARDDYRMSALVEAIVESAPFQMRRASTK